jgi:hypothetical protein
LCGGNERVWWMCEGDGEDMVALRCVGEVMLRGYPVVCLFMIRN